VYWNDKPSKKVLILTVNVIERQPVLHYAVNGFINGFGKTVNSYSQ